MDQRLILECLDPFRDVAYFAILFGHLAYDGCRIPCLGMFCAGTVAYLTAGVFEMRGLFKADKSASLAVPGGMAGVTLLDLFRSEMPHLSLNTLKGYALFRVCHEIAIFFRVTFFAGQ